MSGETPHRMTRYERVIAVPMFVLFYGWGAILVCALLALDRTGVAYRWFVGPYYLLSFAWALLLPLAVRLLWWRQWHLMRRRAARRRAGLSPYQRVSGWIYIGLALLLFAAQAMDSDFLLNICLGGYLIFVTAELVVAVRRRRREKAATAS